VLIFFETQEAWNNIPANISALGCTRAGSWLAYEPRGCVVWLTMFRSSPSQENLAVRRHMRIVAAKELDCLVDILLARHLQYRWCLQSMHTGHTNNLSSR